MTPFLLLLLLLSHVPLTTSKEACNEHATCLYFTTCYATTEVDANSAMLLPTVNDTMNLEEAENTEQHSAGSSSTTTLPTVKDTLNPEEAENTEQDSAGSSSTTTLPTVNDTMNLDEAENTKQGRAGSSSTSTLPTVNGTMSLEEAVNTKQGCSGLAVISTLSILWTSRTSINVSFETDHNDFGFSFGKKGGQIYLEYGSNNIHELEANGINVKDPFKSSSIESLGRTTYAFRVESIQQSFITGLIHNSHNNFALLLGSQTFEFAAGPFLKASRSKLACEREAIHDSCHGRDDCEQVLFDSHSLSCEQVGKLSVSFNSSNWAEVSSVSCQKGLWRFALGNETMEVKESENIDVICHTPAPNETAISPPEDDVGPMPQHDDDTSTAATKKTEKKEDNSSLPGNKWMWIGGVGGLLVVIIVVNVVVCIMCNRRNKNTKKQGKPAKKNKKKGGKGPEDSSTQQPSTSDSKGKGEESTKPLIPSSSNAQPTSDAPTEMNLDLLKTEMIR